MTHTVALDLDNPAILLKKEDGSARYVLHVEQGEIKVDLSLDATAFEILVRQGQALIPSPNATLTTPENEAIRRACAWPIKRLNDNGWRLLLREVQSETMLCVIWYLKDVKLAKTVMRNMSDRAAAMLTEDLIAKYQGRNSDRMTDTQAEEAHQCLEEMLSIMHRLADEGQIPEFRT